MKLGRLNHVGVATPSIEQSLALYRTMFGAEPHGPPFDLPAQGVRVCFVDTPNSQIELIEPLGADSPIVKFLEKNPLGGQHHVCFEVPEIHAAKAELEAKGARVLGEPRIGAHGTLHTMCDSAGPGAWAGLQKVRWSSDRRPEWEKPAGKESRGRDLGRDTLEGIWLQNVYGPEDAEGIDSGYPGIAPYTRGPYA